MAKTKSRRDLWLQLILRDIGELLFEYGVVMSYESMHR